MFARHSSSAAALRAAAILGSFLGVSAAAGAAEYSWQIAGGGSHFDSVGVGSESYLVDATYYLNRVDDGSGPYALASFLDPATRFSVTASRAEATVPASTVDGPIAYTLSGRHVWNATGWYAGGGYSKTDLDHDPSSFVRRTDPEGYSALVGKYLGPRTTLELGIGWSDERTESQLACPPPGVFCPSAMLTTELETRSTSLSAVHVRQFRSLTYALRGGVSETDVDFTRTSSPGSSVIGGGFGPVALPSGSGPRIYAVGAEFFPKRNLGVGVGYSRPDDFDSRVYSLDATWFFKPRIAVQLSLGRSSIPGMSGDPETVGLRLVGRL